MSAPASSAGSSAGADHAAAAASAASGSKRAFPGAATAAADGDRRVQPRHFHAGPNPSASAASSSVAAEAEGPPPAARLYRHALESIFAFLRQGELMSALRVSRGWLGAVQSMSILNLKLREPRVPLRVIADSTVGRHMISLYGLYFRATLAAASPAALDANILHILARQMPQLRHLLDFDLVIPPAAGPFVFPPALKELRLAVRSPAPAADINSAFEAVGRLSLLELFFIRLPSADPLISFAPLAALPQLRDLTIGWFNGEVIFSDAQVDQLRALPRLQRIHLLHLTTDVLRRLLRQPHSLQWEDMPVPNPLDDEATALLPQLPSLTEIECFASCARFDWLQHLPHLTDICLTLSEPPIPGRIDSLLAALRHCAAATHLCLERAGDLTAAHLADLLPRLPRLQDLSLQELSIDSLAFLAQQPMVSQLTGLEIDRCRLLPLTELRHVHALRALESLGLYSSFTERMDSHCRCLYDPPSLLLPQLEAFGHIPPDSDDDDGDE